MDNEILQEEQPSTEQTTVLNATEEKSVASDEGSSQYDTADCGKFKNSKALLEAYNSLQAEFTKKCQKLSEFEKTKVLEQTPEFQDERLEKFLSANHDIGSYKDEFQSFVKAEQNEIGSMEGEWAKFVLAKLSSFDEGYAEDPIVQKYIFQDEKIRNKIIQNYISELNHHKPPVVMTSQSGQRVAEQKPAAPSTLTEAKKLVEEMFS